MELVSVDNISAQIRVNNVDGDEKGLRMELVLEVDINEPIKQNQSHMLGDVRLALEVVKVLGWLADRAEKKLKNFILVDFLLALIIFGFFDLHGVEGLGGFGGGFEGLDGVDVLLVVVLGFERGLFEGLSAIRHSQKFHRI